MTKSCFIRLLVVFTIFLAVVLYIFTHKFDEWVKRPVVEYLVEKSSGDLTNKLGSLAPSPQADSLQAMVNSFIGHFKNAGDIRINLTAIGNMADSLGTVIGDGEVTPAELQRFSIILEKYYQYEKSK